MNNLDKNLLAIRPKIESKDVLLAHSHEAFQNDTLRPIIKMREACITQLIKREKNLWKSLEKIAEHNKKLEAVKMYILKNMWLKNQLIGMVLGMMVETEFEKYMDHAAVFNKRIIYIIIKRIQDTLVN